MKKINFLVCLILFGLTTTKAQTTQATNTVTNENSYLGTSNDYDILFKRMGIEAGKLTTNSINLGLNSKTLTNSIAIGSDAGRYAIGSGSNLFIGNNSGKGGINPSLQNSGTENTFIGINSGLTNRTGNRNTYIGMNSGLNALVGSENIAIGYDSGKNDEGNFNIFIGNRSGAEDGYTGNGNIYIGHNSGFTDTSGGNKLIIDNGFFPQETIAPLIYGDFANDQLRFHGKVGIGGGGITDLNFGNLPSTAGSVNVSKYNLFVKGGILTEEIRVSLQSTWADYVFAKEYQLPTLNEVENHIKEKGHLINVPSAKEVKENGIELGEMAKIQQEKIEELTLYIIELNKRLEAQDIRLNELEKKNNKTSNK